MKQWVCSLTTIWSEGGAHSAADEDKHPNKASNPNNKGDVEVICHSPRHTSSCVKQRACTDSVSLCKQEGADDTEDNELEEASEESAVYGADSPSVSPGSNEHEKCVKANNTIGDAHESSNKGHLGACPLAVDVTVISLLNLSLKEVLVEVLIADSDVATDC